MTNLIPDDAIVTSCRHGEPTAIPLKLKAVNRTEYVLFLSRPHLKLHDSVGSSFFIGLFSSEELISIT